MAIKTKIMNHSFIAQLKAVVGETARINAKQEFTKINIDSQLNSKQLSELIIIGNEYDQEYTIERSGAGLKIEYKQFVASEF